MVLGSNHHIPTPKSIVVFDTIILNITRGFSLSIILSSTCLFAGQVHQTNPAYPSANHGDNFGDQP